jgi:Mrp family chromosome partitioning ATPase
MASKYFALKNSSLINGERFSNGVCYPLKSSLERAVTDLVAKSEARIFDGPTRFVSGVPVPLTKPVSSTAPAAPAPVTRVEKAATPVLSHTYAALTGKGPSGNSTLAASLTRQGRKKK